MKMFLVKLILNKTQSFHDTSTELMPEDEEIFIRLNIPWLPNELQSTTGNKAFDLEKENL